MTNENEEIIKILESMKTDLYDSGIDEDDIIFGRDIKAINRAIKALKDQLQGEPVIRCKDCEHQKKYWHEDKRMKEGGYWVYNCDLISDPFESAPVCGKPEEYCSSAEKKGGADND